MDATKPYDAWMFKCSWPQDQITRTINVQIVNGHRYRRQNPLFET